MQGIEEYKLLADNLTGGWTIVDYKIGNLIGKTVVIVFAHRYEKDVLKGKWMLLIGEELNFIGPELYKKLNEGLIAFDDCWEGIT